MSIAAKLRRAPLRVSTGAFILNTGLSKLRRATRTPQSRLHAVASGAFPQFSEGRSEGIPQGARHHARPPSARPCCCRSSPPGSPAWDF